MENKYKVEQTQFGEKISHPSYGTLRFSRITGSKTILFGSCIEHQDTVLMELYHANITRELHRDWIHGNNLIAKVEMSYSQFAEAITSFGFGTGVPVTVRYTEKDGQMPDCDFVSKREQFTNEFKKTRKRVMDNSQQLIQDVANLFSQKKTLTKADKEHIMENLNKIYKDIGTNIDFVADQFNEQMDKTVKEAKGEIEAFCQNKINTIANAALVEHRDELLKLENPVNFVEEDMITEDVKEQLFQILGLMEEERKNATVKCCLSNGDSVYFWFDTLHDGTSFTGTTTWYEDSYACVQDFMQYLDAHSLQVTQILRIK